MAFDIDMFRFVKKKCEICKRREAEFGDRIDRYLDKSFVVQVRKYGTMIWKDIFVCKKCLKEKRNDAQ